MTVAAVILSATADGAVADTLGQPRVRRLADLAWSGGALPIVVLAPDPDGVVAAALAGSEAVYGSPAPPESGPVGQMVRGTELAIGRGQRHDRGPALAGADDLGRARDDHLADRGARHGPRHDAAAGLARRAGLAGARADGAPGRAAGGRAGPDAAVRHRRPGRGGPDAGRRDGRPGRHPRRRHGPGRPARPTRARPIRPPGTPTNGAPTSRPKPASSPPDARGSARRPA